MKALVFGVRPDPALLHDDWVITRPRLTGICGSDSKQILEWIIERRMAEARTMLEETDLPVAEIARRVGVFDAGYFSRLFTRTHGISPRQWRGRHG
jgi:AraC-like DNA-binding protein